MRTAKSPMTVGQQGFDGIASDVMRRCMFMVLGGSNRTRELQLTYKMKQMNTDICDRAICRTFLMDCNFGFKATTD